MPWEKNFDEDAALGRAMEVFWAKGYEATSISDLVAAMGINKGSLYNTFGSKKVLFTRAFLKYDREERRNRLARLERMDDSYAAIEALFDGFIAQSERDPEHKGCLVVNTALEFPSHPPDVQDLVSASLEDLERFFERTIRTGQERGQIARGLDAAEAATWLVSQVVGLRVLSRGAFLPDRLRAIRAQALATVAPFGPADLSATS
jgi:TetR/AcrR family transcriptional repressor of nem operon